MSTDPKNWASEFGTYPDFQRVQARDAFMRVEIEAQEVKDLFGWMGASGLMIEEELRKYAFEAERRIAMRTPVKTGRARNSWHTVQPGEIDDYTYTDDLGNPFDGRVSDVPGPLEFFVCTNVVYMIALEAGHSRQAPQGMVAITLAEISGALEARLELIFREREAK